jgi:hypothetical protein
MPPSIKSIRNYRFILNSPIEFNKQGTGIALFDYISSFLGAFILIKALNVSKSLETPIYLMVIPLGIFFHIIFKQNTFLNNKIFTTQFNIYQVYLGASILFLCKIIFEKNN